MAAVAAYLIAATGAMAIACFIGRRDEVPRDPATNLGDVAARNVSILGSLAAFAVTGIVLLVTLGRDLPDASGPNFTTLLTLFLVAYMGFLATSILMASIVDPEPRPPDGFDAPGAQFAGAAITLYFTVILGWTAFRPLFLTFGLDRMAEIASWLLLAAILAGCGSLALTLVRGGIASPRSAFLIPVLAAVATLAYALVAWWLGWRSTEATLALTGTSVVFGSIGYALVSLVPILGRQGAIASLLTRYGRLLMLAYAQASVVFVGFLYVSVLQLG